MLASTILSSFLTNLRILVSPNPVARHKRRRQLPASSSRHAEVLEVRAMLSTAPVVSGVTVSNVTGTTATFSSNVVSDGGDPITDRGFVYSQSSTNGNPQIGGNGVLQVSTSGTIGTFSIPVTSLTAGAGYSIASYATNSQGTTYSNITLLGSATAPTITGFTGAQTYHQGGAAISFASGITLADADSTTLSSATVSFTNWQAGDRLDFDNTFALQHTFTEDLNAHTATLSITGTGSLANYETTLQSMQFRNVAGIPNTSTRIASITVNDGSNDSSTASESIDLLTSDQAPLVAEIETSPLVVGVGQSTPAFVPISDTLTITDADSNNLTGATVQITSGYQNDSNGHDVLSFTNRFGITGTFDAATGTLTLSGSSYVGNYREALRSVMFGTSGSAVSTTPRTLTILAFDDAVTPVSSIALTRSVTVSTSSQAPVISGFSGTQTFNQGGTPLDFASAIVVSDADSSRLNSARVSFTNWQAGDRLFFDNTFSLQHTFTEDLTAHTASLSITGSGTIAAYQTTLRSLEFKNVAGAPNTSTRIATIVVNDGGNNSNLATENLAVQSTAQGAPVVFGIENAALNFAPNDPGTPSVPISSTVQVTDPDSNNLTSATVQITSGYQNDTNGHDVLSFTNQFGITGSFDAATGKLTLSGSSYVGNYREALRTVTFGNSGTAVNTANRTLTITVYDDSATPVASTPVTRTVTISNSNSNNVTVVAPAALENTSGGFGGVTPFNFSSTSGIHTQVLYDSSQFSNLSGPQIISEIRFRPIDASGGFFGSTLNISNVTLKLSTSSRSELTNPLSSTFADNLGSDALIVYSGALSISTAGIGSNATGPFDYVITLQTPFNYNPASGSLLLDTVVNPGATIQGNSPTGSFPRFDTADSTTDGVSSVVDLNLGTSPTTGIVSSAGPVTQFVLVNTPLPPG